MGYCAALCPGALFLVPFLTNRDLKPYLWMRDLVFCDPSSISFFVIAAQVCLWSRSFIFLQRAIGPVTPPLLIEVNILYINFSIQYSVTEIILWHQHRVYL